MPDRSRPYDKSPEGIAYRNRFREERYDRVELVLPAGMKAELDALAKEAGVSRSQWILSAIEKQKEKG